MPLRRRLRAALLAALFAGGSFVVPVVDGALFHSGRTRAVAQVHLDSQSDQSCHAERCLLDAPIAGVGMEAAEATPAVPAAEGFIQPAVRPVVASFTRSLPAGRHSRAPPASLA